MAVGREGVVEREEAGEREGVAGREGAVGRWNVGSEWEVGLCQQMCYYGEKLDSLPEVKGEGRRYPGGSYGERNELSAWVELVLAQGNREAMVLRWLCLAAYEVGREVEPVLA